MSSGWKLGKKLKEATSHHGFHSHHGNNSSGSGTAASSAKSTAPSSSGGSLSAASSHNVLTTPASSTSSQSASATAASRGGMLTIRVVEAKGLSIPAGYQVPEEVQRAVSANPQVGSLTVGSLAQAGFAGAGSGPGGRGNRESMQRKHNWWLPYLVLGFDKNEVLVDCLGGTLESPVWMYKADFDVSTPSEISISAYLRSTSGLSGRGVKNDMGDDVFLSGLTVTPTFDAHKVTDEWYRSTGGGSGTFHLQIAFKPNTPNQSLSINDFELLKVVGKGSFGKVMQVRKKDTGRIYALKTIRKAHIVNRSEVTHTLAERTVLGQVNCTFICRLKFSFQSAEKLYLVLAFVNGGELFHHLQREGRFNEERSRFYAAELLTALEHLHSYDVIYRDLKPENILLDYTGHIALCDFGLCKLNMGESETTNTFCGTPEYLAPELLLGHGYSKTVDWWTLGVLLYEMLSGLPPYYDENVNEMYRKILQNPLRFGDEIKPEARSLLTGLLTRDPAHRLGNNGADEIKRHPFFAKIDWKRLINKGYTPPFKPSVESAIDTSNFDSEFTGEQPVDSVVEDSHLSETVQQQFKGFTYVDSGHMAESVR